MATIQLALAAIVALTAAVAADPMPSFDGMYPPELLADLDSVSRVTNLGTGEVLYANASGHVNIEYGVSMLHDSRFMIGSNSKLYTTVSLYQLQEAGKLNLSSSVTDLLDASDFAKFGYPGQSTWCPQLPGNSTCQTITVHQLLAMSSGLYPALGCSVPPTQPGECNTDLYTASTSSIAAMVGSFINNPMIFVPGTRFVYTNPNFVLASYLVEKFSGMTFAAYIKQHISDVIGQSQTYFDLFDGEMGPMDAGRTTQYYKFYENSTAAGFPRLGYGRLRMELNTGAVSGTGGLVSTVPEEVRFWQVLFNKTGKGAPLLQDPASVAAILHPWTFVNRMPISSNVTVFNYYAQGIGVFCLDAACSAGPQFIVYTGQTLGSTTSNALAYGEGCNMTMAQFWTSSVQATASESNYDRVRKAQNSRVLDFVHDWDGDVPMPRALKWMLLDQHSPCKVSPDVPLSLVLGAFVDAEHQMFGGKKPL
uniref:Beta-lactamase-related domain-containing protein n=1 Tax=Neobodo designis TaxID=312471 RepID=A0A7S1LBF0_NEODS